MHQVSLIHVIYCSMRTCPCGREFQTVTNKKWCSQACPKRLARRYEQSHNWYLRNKAKPYDPHGVCPCGQDFDRRYGGREQRYCSRACRVKYLSRRWAAKRSEQRHLLNRKSRLHRRHTTFDEYLMLFDAQDGKCAICQGIDPGSTQGRKRRYFCVDHCHETGRIRGLLCAMCNAGLGMFRDRPERMTAAIAYLSHHVKPKE